MTQRFLFRVLLLMLSGALVVPLSARQPTEEAARKATEAATSEAKKAAWSPVRPGKYDATVAWYVARMLEDYHYSKHTLDREWSSKFLDRYLEALDPQHLHFLQSDLAQFEPYRTELGDLTINQRRASDLGPAFEIFNRFIERLQQRVSYADNLLKTEKFAFDTNERVALIRKDLPYPKDLDEAQKLWRDRLRSEFLQEKLSKIEARKRPDPRRASSKNKPQTKSDEEEIAATLTHTYHLHLKNFTDWNNEDVLQSYLAALTHVYDPHSDYMGPDHLEQFAISMNLKLSGIGAQLTSKEGYCTIDKLLDGYPAAKSKKIREKDRIVAVAQGEKKPVDVVDMNLNKVVHLIRGPKGTEVRLTIVPDGSSLSETTVVSLVREDIKLEDQAAKAKIIEVPNPAGGNLRLGVIDLKSFYAPFEFSGKPTEVARSKEGEIFTGGKSTSEDVDRLLKKLKAENVQGVVLDLRYNGGGSLEEAVKLTGLFIEHGPVVQVQDWQQRIEKEEDKDSSVAFDGPLIVLTSRFSASASEIVAGALQDYGRALVVGDASTHGKGTVQSVHYLSQIMNVSPTNDLGALKLTIKKFYRASGASTQLRGVTPDIVLPSIWNESKEIGESSLENPLPWDTVPRADYKPSNMVTDFLPGLRKASEQRLKGDKDYTYVREDIELYKKQQADRTVSLNEKERLKERDEIDARQKAREKERKARPEPKEKVYEITLRQAAKPGLPPPVQKTNTFASSRTNLQGTGSVQISNSVATESASAGTLDADPEEDKAPFVDAALNETEHILVDYLAVLRKQAVAVH